MVEVCEGIPADGRLLIRDEHKAEIRKRECLCRDLHEPNLGKLNCWGAITNYGFEVRKCPVPVLPS